MRTRHSAVTATTAALLVALTTGLLTALPGPSAQAAVPPCSRGLVALTFDDGPAHIVTPRLVRLLRERRVPATFFMVGSRVRTAPADARLVARNGFVVANHTWSHPQLTRVGNATIRSEMPAPGEFAPGVSLKPSVPLDATNQLSTPAHAGEPPPHTTTALPGARVSEPLAEGPNV